MERVPNCLVIGAGGVGVITAYSLFKKRGCLVSLVARSDYEKVLTTGYKITSCDYGEIENWRPHSTFQSVEDVVRSNQFYDYILVTTKNIPDGPTPVSSIIRPVIEANDSLWQITPSLKERATNLVLIQNGINIENEIIHEFKTKERSGSKLPKINLISGVQLIASTKMGECEILHKNKDHLSLGAFDKNDQDSVDASQALVNLYLNENENHCEFDKDVRYTRWRKLLYNATINTTTAICGLDFSRCLEFGTDKTSTEFEIVRPAMQEVIDLAKKIDNITLEINLVDFFVDITRTMVYRPSMCVDIQKGQLMEVEVILGNVVRMAKENNIAIPHLSMLYNILVVLQGKLKEQRGLLKFDETTAKLVQP